MTSCGSSESPVLSEKEKMVLDSIQKELNCEINYGTTKDFLSFSKPYDIDLTLSNAKFNKDSLAIISQIVAERFYPNVTNKEKYKNLTITIESKSDGNVGTGTDITYTYEIGK